jgi:hypothetical protein
MGTVSLASQRGEGSVGRLEVESEFAALVLEQLEFARRTAVLSEADPNWQHATQPLVAPSGNLDTGRPRPVIAIARRVTRWKLAPRYSSPSQSWLI